MFAVLKPKRRSALASSMKALERIAAYTLPMELDRRILELAINRLSDEFPEMRSAL